MAGACAAGVLWVYIGTFHVEAVKELDLRTYFAFVVAAPQGREFPNDFVGLIDPPHFAVLAPIAPAIALARGRPWLAVAAVAVIGCATLTTELLKEITLTRRFPVSGEADAWPSGHVTAAMALALALVLVVPDRWRAFTAATGMLFVAGIATTILLLGKHVASDVVAGMLVAGAWSGLVIAALRAWRVPAPDEDTGRSRLMLPLAAAAAIAVAAGAVATAVANDQELVAPRSDALAIAGGILVLTGLAVAIVGGTALTAPDDGGSAARRA